MTSEKLAAQVKDIAGKLSAIQSARLAPEHERKMTEAALYLCLDTVLTQFAVQVDADRKTMKTQRDEVYLKSLYVRTLDLVDVGCLPGKRTIAA